MSRTHLCVAQICDLSVAQICDFSLRSNNDRCRVNGCGIDVRCSVFFFFFVFLLLLTVGGPCCVKEYKWLKRSL